MLDIPNPFLATGGSFNSLHSRRDNVTSSVVCSLVILVFLWTILTGISHTSPDPDNIEELIWASSFEWGYYKHPPMPAWFMYGLVSVFGKHIWLTFFAGELSSAVALWFIWRFGCEFTTPRRSMIAMLMISVSSYFSVRATMYNHNSVQMWSIVASTWLYYRSLRYGRLSDWFWFGTVCGITFLTKYSALIQFTAFLAFLLRHRYWRNAAVLRGLALATAVFIAVISPHILWLFHHGLGPLQYAEHSISAIGDPKYSRFSQIFGFLSTQAGRLSPMAIAGLALYIWSRKAKQNRHDGVHCAEPTNYWYALSPWDRSFLLIVGLTPLISTVVVSSIMGTHLGSSWASTFFVLFGFYTYRWLRINENIALRRVMTVIFALQILLATGYAAGGPLAYYTGYVTDATYPGAVISRKLQAVWYRYVPDKPLALIASNTWLGGTIAVHMKHNANVFIDGEMKKSPWLTSRSEAIRCGMLVAYSTSDHSGGPSAEIRDLYEASPYKGALRQQWSTPHSPIITVYWGVIPPRPDCNRSRE